MDKYTYLVRIDPENPDSGLRSATKEEYKAICKWNQTVPLQQKRKFIESKIPEGTYNDIMLMEAPLESYKQWKQDEKRHRRCMEGVENYEHLSFEVLLAAISKDDSIQIKLHLSTSDEIDEHLLEEDRDQALRNDLKAWKPWAIELGLFYITGRKRTCNPALKEMFGWEERTAERRKKQFENHVRLFAKHYHNGYEYKEGEQA